MKLSLLISLFLLVSCVYSFPITPTLELKATAPSAPPFFIGTEINTITISFTDSNGADIQLPNNAIDIFVGDTEYSLLKLDKKYVTNPDLMITPDLIKNNTLTIRLETISGYELSKKNFEYAIEKIEDYLQINKQELKTKYNYGQEISLEYNLVASKNDITNLKMWVLKPSVENNSFLCEEFHCTKKIEIPYMEDQNTSLLIYGVFSYHGRIIPFVDSYFLDLTNRLNIDIINPDKEGYVYNPFTLQLKVNYSNGEIFFKDYAKLIFDNEEVSIKKKGNYYVLNKFMFPFFGFKHELIFVYENNQGGLNLDVTLKPTLWFYLLISFFGFIFLIELIIVIVKKYKKVDINELIAKRDIYKDKQKELKKKFISGKVTKAYFDDENEKIEYVISYLNKQIIELEKSHGPDKKTRPMVYSQPVKEIKIDSFKQKTEAEEKPETPKVKKESFFSRLFKKKPKEEKFEYLSPSSKEDKKKAEDENIKIESWYK